MKTTKRLCSLFLVLTMLFTFISPDMFAFANDSDANGVQAMADETLPDENLPNEEDGGEETSPEISAAVDVSTAEEMEKAIEDGASEIRIIADFEIDRTFFISQDTYIYTDEAHTLTRKADFAGDVFVVGEDKDGNASDAVLSLGKIASSASDMLVINGNSENMTVDVVGTVIFVCGGGQADLFDNLTVTNCKKVGNERATESKHGMSNTSYIGGPVAIAVADSKINIYGGKYTNNSVNTSGASVYGGAFYNFSVINIYGGLFEGNSAVRAGAFYNYRQMYVYRATINNNTASTNGGAFYLPASTGARLYLGGENDVVESEVVFEGNSADNGGAIYSTGRIYAFDTTFKQNSASENGGAVCISGNYNILELTDCAFDGNSAQFGGAVYSSGKTTYSVDYGFNAKNTSFTGNTSSKSGGAVYLKSEVVGLVESCSFRENKSTAHGGALANSGAVVTIDKSTLSSNTGYNGAALYFEESAIGTLNSVTATGNDASKSGGVLYSTNSTLNVYNSTIDGNSAPAASGMYFAGGTTANVYKTVFNENVCDEKTTGNSGTLFIYTSGGEVTVHSCTFTNNTTYGYGGAMLISGSSIAKLYNIKAVGNTAGKGGVAYITTSGTVVDIVGLTVSGNTATNGGPIIWGNTANAKLNINKENYRDLDVDGELPADYWSTAIANKLTTKDSNATIPGYTDFTNEDMSTLWNSVDVKNLTELQTALNAGEKFIRVVADITFDKSVNVTSDATIFTTDNYKLVRASGFGGDMFVVGGENGATLVLGNSVSETKDLLTIDGGNVSADGSAIRVAENGKLEIYSNATFVNNKNSAARGGAISVSETGIVNIHNGAFRANGGNAAIYNLGTVNIKNGTFEENVSGVIQNAGAANIQGGSFKNNSAANGGVVYNTGALSVSGATFEANSAENGGVIYSEKGNLDINENTFAKNTASLNGGAVYVADGTFTNNQAVYSENKAKVGGAVYVAGEDVSFTDTACSYVKNTADTGAAMFVSANGADVSGTAFEANSAKENGGAIALANCSDAVIMSVTATGNKAADMGGFIYTGDSEFELSDSKISANTADFGGAVAIQDTASAKITNNEFDKNIASSKGGAIYTTGKEKSVILSGGTFNKNNASYGGAIYVEEGTAEINNAKFNGNIADLDGGVVAVENGGSVVMNSVEADGNSADSNGGFAAVTNADFKMQSGTVKNSSAGFDGGAIALNRGATSNINNVTFSANTAERNGGAIIAKTKGAKNVMKNCTFTDNASAKNGGVAYVVDNSALELYDSKVTGSDATNGSVLYIDGASTVVTVNGMTLSDNTKPLIWGANTSATLNINKNNYSDADASSINDAYWSKTIVNKITVKEITGDAPPAGDEGNDIQNAASVSSAEDLEKAINAGEKYILIADDFEIDRTFYITTDITIFSNDAKKLTRKADFAGDIFVVGEAADGTNSMVAKGDAKLTLGNPGSEEENLLIIDGNRDNMTVDVTGTVIFLCHGARANLYKNTTIQNCYKVGNVMAEKSGYGFARPNRIGGAVAIISSSVMNVYGGNYKNNGVREEDTSTEEGRNSTIGGVFYNDGNLRIYDGLFDGNTAARGALVYNYCVVKILGGTFQNNYASTTGGVYYSPLSSSVILVIGSFDSENNPVLFKDNSARSNAGVIYSAALTSIVIHDGTVFDGNKAVGGNGGAIYTQGMLTAKGVTFRNNTANGAAGALYATNATDNYYTRFVNIKSTVFEENKAATGGAVYAYASSDEYPNGAIVTVSDSVFNKNAAVRWTDSSACSGGAIYAGRKSTLTFSNTEFKDNTSDGEAGTMYLVTEADVDINDSIFTGNTAKDNGGALSIRSAKVDITNSVIEESYTPQNGGAIYIAYISACDVNSDVTINGCDISRNETASSGGAIYATRRAIEDSVRILTVNNTTFSENVADNRAGAILVASGSESYFKDVSFIGNNTYGKESIGGALVITGNGTKVEVDSGIFTKNTTKTNGGAIHLAGNSSIVANNISASKNNARDNGGFLYAEEANIKMYGSTIRGNYSKYGGGMYLSTNAVSEIYDTEFKDNYTTEDNGGALFVYTGLVDTLLNGNIFTGNTAANAGGAVYVSGESNLKMYDTIAKENTAKNGGFMYETKAYTTVLLSGLTVSGNTATAGGPIIWGNTKNAVLNIDKSKYTDLDAEVIDDAYWTSAIANALTVNDVTEEVPEKDIYVGKEEPKEEAPATQKAGSIQDVLKLGKSSSDKDIDANYAKLPRLDNSSNFMSRGTTKFDNINGETVTVDSFVYPYDGIANNSNAGMGIMLYQTILYKEAHPEEEVSIDVAFYRLSVDAAVNINRNSRYFGYMRNLGYNDTDSYGFVKIVYLLTTAAKMGIHVNVIGQIEGYPITSTYRMDSYFAEKTALMCDPAYVPNGKVGDFLKFTHSMWTVGTEGKGGTDMMHMKMCAVSHYLDMNGVAHKNAIYTTSSNLDGIKTDGRNGNRTLQTGTIISDHAEMYNVAVNYLRLLAEYSDQEEIIEMQDIVSTRSEQQIDMILAGEGDKIPKAEQLVYIGTENDDVFELYFTPFGGGRLAWDETYNPYCKYLREMYNSEDYIFFIWNTAQYSNSYPLAKQMEEVFIEAFHKNKNPKNKIYANIEEFDATTFDDLVVGKDIGFKSFNQRDFGTIHNKDMHLSYVKDGQRYNVSLMNSINPHGGSMYYQSNFLIVIKEKTCSEDSVFSTIARYTAKGDFESHEFGEEVYYEGSETQHANKHYECKNCGYWKITEEYHKGGEWICDKEPTETENGICHNNCVICGQLVETMEISKALDTNYEADKTTGKKFTASADTLVPVTMTKTPRTFEATVLLPKTVKDRGGVIIGNNGNSGGTPINFEIHTNGKPKLFYMVGKTRADLEFKTDIRSNDPVHIAITIGDTKATLYVNGKATESINLPFAYPESTSGYTVGGDSRKGNDQYFKGTIYSVNVFDDVRTVDEIKRDMIYVPAMAEGLQYTGYYGDEETVVMIGDEENLSGMKFDTSKPFLMDKSFESTPYTFEALINIPESMSERGGVICGNYDTDKQNAINIEIHEKGKPRLFFVNQGVKYDTIFDADVRSDSPVHMAIVVEGTTANLYVNGKLADAKTLSSELPVLTDAFKVGSDYRTTNVMPFKGALYNLAFYSDARSADEICADAMITDASDDACMYAMFVTENGIVNKISGQTFDTMTMGYIDCALKETPRTFEAVVQLPESVTGRGGIIAANNGGDEDIINFEIYKDGKPRFYYITNGVTTDCVFNTDIRSDKPVHIAVTMDGFVASLYVNGEFKESVELDYALGDSTQNFVIGGDYRLGNAQYFKGTIYSVNIFGDVRTAEEIAKDAVYVKGDEDGILFSGNYISEEKIVLDADDMHPDKVVVNSHPKTENESGVESFACAHCGKIINVKVTPSDDVGFNKINHSASKGLAPNELLKLTDLGASPKTVEITLQMPEEYAERAGVLLGNYDKSENDQINFEIYNNGQPRLWFKSAGTTYSYIFTTDIRSSEKVHLTFTVEGTKASIYVNGEFKESVEITGTYPETSTGFVVGADNRAVDPQKFIGTIYSVNLFSDVRTADEIKTDAIGVASNTEGLIYSNYFQD